MLLLLITYNIYFSVCKRENEINKTCVVYKPVCFFIDKKRKMIVFLTAEFVELNRFLRNKIILKQDKFDDVQSLRFTNLLIDPKVHQHPLTAILNPLILYLEDMCCKFGSIENNNEGIKGTFVEQCIHQFCELMLDRYKPSLFVVVFGNSNKNGTQILRCVVKYIIDTTDIVVLTRYDDNVVECFDALYSALVSNYTVVEPPTRERWYEKLMRCGSTKEQRRQTPDIFDKNQIQHWMISAGYSILTGGSTDIIYI